MQEKRVLDSSLPLDCLVGKRNLLSDLAGIECGTIGVHQGLRGHSQGSSGDAVALNLRPPVAALQRRILVLFRIPLHELSVLELLK